MIPPSSPEQVLVLDHGYVKLIESWGSDERIIESARMSTQKGFQGWGPECKECLCNTGYNTKQANCHVCGTKLVAGDEKLLRYLWENKHSTPFEVAGATFEVQAPIFVFREWHRHRTMSYNEASARYAPLPPWDYVPTLDRVMRDADKANKQSRAHGDVVLTEGIAREWLTRIKEHYEVTEELYQWGLNSGIPKELARIVLPVARYSKMRATANLRNWLAFLTLRDEKHAQWEIQQFAGSGVRELLTPMFPRTLALFQEKRSVSSEVPARTPAKPG